MRLAFGRIACTLLLLGLSLERAAFAGPCTVPALPDRLADDVGWSEGAGGSRRCASGFGDYGMTPLIAGEAATRLAASQLKLPPTVNHLPSSSGVLSRSRVAHVSSDTTFQDLKIGAGGFLRNINISPMDNTKVARADTGGGYYYNPSAPNPGNAGGKGTWVQVVTATSIPTADFTPGDEHGVEELAAYDTTRLYMNYNGWVFYSGDAGAHWARGTGFVQDGLGSQQTYSNLLAIDPQNPDFVLAASAGHGMYVTSNGTSGASATWSLISTASIPAGTQMGVCFDPRTVSGGKTQVIYVWSQGHGVYRSTNAGSTWALANATGNPTSFKQMRCDPLGNVWVVDEKSSTLKRFDGKNWSKLSPGVSPSAVAIDQTNCASLGACHVFVIGGGGDLSVSTNGGTSWINTTTQNRAATDIPWLALASSFSTGGGAFDNAGVLWYSEGIGVWKTTPPTTATSFTWTSVSTTIEQLVANVVLAPPGGKPNVFSWDRAQFYSASLSAYPSSGFGSTTNNDITPIIGGWGADWATGAPSTIVMTASSNLQTLDYSGYSSDGGKTWTVFGTPSSTSNSIGTGSKTWTVVAGLNFSTGDTIEIFQTSNLRNMMLGTVTSYSGTSLTINVTNTSGSGSGITDWTVHTFPMGPDPGYAGAMAAGSATNFMWLPATFSGDNIGNAPHYTTDGGVHWTSLASYFNTNFGVPTSRSSSGWGATSLGSSAPMMVAADRANQNTFYLYNSNDSGAGGGVYQSTNGGATWTRKFTGPSPGGLTGSNLAKLKAVPNIASTNTAGHLFMISNQGGDGLIYSKDAGATWAKVQNSGVSFRSVNGFGFGAAFPGQSYPAIYVGGWSGANAAKASYGIWRCTNFNPATGVGTWTQLVNFPVNSFFYLKDIEGDKVTAGTLYGGFQGVGFFYGHLNFLLGRDLDPGSNDNYPMWLEKAG